MYGEIIHARKSYRYRGRVFYVINIKITCFLRWYTRVVYTYIYIYIYIRYCGGLECDENYEYIYIYKNNDNKFDQQVLLVRCTGWGGGGGGEWGEGAQYIIYILRKSATKR